MEPHKDKEQYRSCLEHIKIFLILPFCTCCPVMDKGERLAAVSILPCSLDAILIDSLAVWRDM